MGDAPPQLAEIQRLVQTLQARVAELEAEVAALREENARLRAELAKKGALLGEAEDAPTVPPTERKRRGQGCGRQCVVSGLT